MPGTLDTLTGLYRAAARRLRAQIDRDLRAGAIGSATYRARQLEAIRLELARLAGQTRPLESLAVAQAYTTGVVVAELAPTVSAAQTIGFAGFNRGAVTRIARELNVRTAGAIDLVGRRVDDAYRQTALEQAAQAIAAGDPRRDMSARLKDRLIRDRVTDSLTGFVDRRGRRWDLDVYTRMVARTTTREAVTAGTLGRLAQGGQDLVTISDHGTECEVCKPYEGNTYSINGTTAGYDVLPDYPPFHPNCEHYLTPGADDLNSELDRIAVDLGSAAGANAAAERVLGLGLNEIAAAGGGILAPV